MKNLKKFFAAALLLTLGMPAMAQEAEYEFQKHAFVTLQGGAQYTLGEAKFADLLSPNVQLGLGYQFSPIFAARLQANTWQSKGGWHNFKPAPEVAPFDRHYAYNYVAPGVDLMLNLSNLICGYNPERVFNLTAFLGGGLNVAWNNKEVNRIADRIANLSGYNLEYLWDGTKLRPFGRGGLQASFRLSDAVSILLEGNANILSDHYNSKKAGNPDWYFNALAGLRINLGKTHTKAVPAAPIVPQQPAEQPKPVVKPDAKPEPKPVVETVEPLRRDIFFEINKWEVRESEIQKVKDIADYLTKYPNAKVSLCGYADVQTGNDKINDKLGLERVNVVKKMLIEQYGIPESRISSDSKGAREQPFAVNEQNRVTIAIAE